ncbi:MAG: metallophosphoesterase [Byssovorax sp.]
MRSVHALLALPLAAAALLFAGRSRAEGTTPFRKGPYLQALGSAGVTVKVELAERAPAKLVILAAGTENVIASAEAAEPKSFHALRAEGLTPGTPFDYRVESGAAKSALGHFTTAPVDDRPFRFQIYGDSRDDGASHAAVVRAMLAEPADFLINTGDMVHSGVEPRDWEDFFAIERDLLRDRCVFAAVGNHELYRGNPEGGVAFLRYFASYDQGQEERRLHGSFRWGNTRFFLLNAMDTWTGEERDWLRQALDSALREPGLAHRIAVLHHGPFSSGPHGANKALADQGIVAIMRDRKVDLVLAGHDHIYERGEGEGLKYLVSGGAGAPLYERKFHDAHTQVLESVHHFISVAVEGETITTVAKRASGGIIERCVLRAGAPWDCNGGAGESTTGSGAKAAPAGPSGVARSGACGCEVAGAACESGWAGWLAGGVMLIGARRAATRARISTQRRKGAKAQPDRI